MSEENPMNYTCRMRIGQDSVTWYDEEGNETMHIDSSNKVTLTQQGVSPQRSEDINLSCKSTQARLATSWGYVKAKPQRNPLTPERVREALYTTNHSDLMGVVRAIEKAHGIGSETTLVKAQNERLE